MIPFFTLLYPSSPVFTLLHPSLPFFTLLYPSSPFFTLLHPSLPFFTLLYPSSPFFTLLHPSLSTYTLQKFLIFIFKLLSHIVYKMTNNTLFNFNRQQTLKTWQPLPNIHLQPEEIQYYNYKIQTDGIDICYPQEVLNIAEQQTQVNGNYLKHIVLKYMRNLIEYIENKGVVLEDIEWNIKLILNEIVTNKVSEDYYLNTINIYESISEKFDDVDIYDLINQAIRLDNKRMLYYLIFMEDEEMADRLSVVIRE